MAIELRKNYVILDELNRWHSTGKDATPEEMAADLIEVGNRLKEQGEGDVELIIFETVGEPIRIQRK